MVTSDHKPRQYQQEIEDLKRDLRILSSSRSEEKARIVNAIRTLEELDGWEPGLLTERISALERDVQLLKETLETICEKLAFDDIMGNLDIGFRDG